MIKIDKGVPLAPETRGGKACAHYPFPDMQVGDSFAVEYESPVAAKDGQRKLSSIATAWAKRRPGYKFTTRRVDCTVRLWRVAPPPSLLDMRVVAVPKVHILEDDGRRAA